jgi:hypothetical protein
VVLTYIIASIAGGLVFRAWLKYSYDNQHETLINNLKGFVKHYFIKLSKLIGK